MKFLSCQLIAAMYINLSMEYLSGEGFLMIISLSLIWMPLLDYVLLIDAEKIFNIDRKCQDYVCVKGEYQSISQKIKHYLRHENKVDNDKELSSPETLTHTYKHVCKHN